MVKTIYSTEKGLWTILKNEIFYKDLPDKYDISAIKFRYAGHITQKLILHLF